MGEIRSAARRRRDGRFFSRLVELAHAQPAEVAYVGDRVDNDVLPALEEGLVVFHLRRGPWGRLQETPADAIAIDSLAEIPSRLGCGPLVAA